MNPRTRRKLSRWFSVRLNILLVILMVTNTLLPAISHAAPPRQEPEPTLTGESTPTPTPQPEGSNVPSGEQVTETEGPPGQGPTPEATTVIGQQDEAKLYLPLVFKASEGLIDGVTISPKAGGTVTSSDQQVTITFRPDGLPEAIAVSFQETMTVTLPSNFALRGPQTTVQAQWLDSRQAVDELDPEAQPILTPGAAKPQPPQFRYWATVSMRLAESQSEPERLAIARLAPGSQKWEILPTQVDPEAGLALAETERLGAFALIENVAFWGSRDLVGAAIGDEIIVDDGDTGFERYEADGTLTYWWPSDCGPGSCWGGDAYWTWNRSSFEKPPSLDDPWNWAIWTPPLTQTGYYYVEVWIPADHATTTGAEYKIYHDARTDIVPVNQATISGAWVPLGPYHFTADGSGSEYVYLDDVVPETDELGSQIGFDAVKFVYAGDNLPPFDPFDFYRLTYGYRPWMEYGGDPVNMVTGQAIQQQQDVTIPAPGFDLAVVRTYNSLDMRAGLFGTGWTSNLDMQLEVRESDGIVLVRHADGYTPAFYPQDGGGYQAENGVFDTLEETAGGFSLTKPNGTRYEFDGEGRLQRMVDRRDNGLTFTYTGEQLTEVTGAVGRSLVLTYEGALVKQITDPLNRTWIYTYEDGYLTEVQDANGGVYEYEYEDERLVRFKDPEEIPYLENIYDAQGRVVEQIDAEKNHSFITYTTIVSDSQPYNATIYTDNEGNDTTYLYDSLFRVVKIEDPLGHTTGYKYDQDYNRVAVTDARGNTTHYGYDEQGNLVERRDPVESCSAAPYSDDVTSWTYNDQSLVTSMTNALEHTWVYEYDGPGNLVYARAPDGGETQAAYNNWGLPFIITDTLSRVTRYAYDGYGNLTHITDPAGHLTVSHYDLAGREVGYTDANDHTAVFHYDPNDNLTGIADPKGQAHAFTYDLNDLLIESVDRRGVAGHFRYDDNLKLIAERDFADGQWTEYGYDRLYRRVTMTDTLGYVTRYGYDPDSRLKTVTDPLQGITHYEYDPNDNLTKVIDPLVNTTQMTYDAANRLTTLIDAEGNPTHYCYDAEDQLVRVENARGR